MTTTLKATRLLTTTRLYVIEERADGTVSARYQPLNPKTGRPWQAWRDVAGRDAYVLTGRSEVSEARPLPLPSDWSQDGRWFSAQSLFSSMAVLRAALPADALAALDAQPA